MQTDLRPTFESAFTRIKGYVHRAASWDEAASILLGICKDKQAASLATAQLPHPLDRALDRAELPAGMKILRPPYAHASLPGAIDVATVGSTGMAFAIAETGTMVEVSLNDATRLVSGLPRTHVGIVSARELVPTLFDASPRLRSIFMDNPRDCVVSFLSGPSRTGDIELRLTLGVHGPEHAHAILLDASLDPESDND